MAEFSADEKSRILHFLDYPDWESLVASVGLGVPATSQFSFQVNDTFHRMSDAAMKTIRKDLCECESIENEISQARSRLKATRIGTMHTNENEISQLRQELDRWCSRLANDLGVCRNPYAEANRSPVNARVIGGGGDGW